MSKYSEIYFIAIIALLPFILSYLLNLIKICGHCKHCILPKSDCCCDFCCIFKGNLTASCSKNKKENSISLNSTCSEFEKNEGKDTKLRLFAVIMGIICTFFMLSIVRG